MVQFFRKIESLRFRQLLNNNSSHQIQMTFFLSFYCSIGIKLHWESMIFYSVGWWITTVKLYITFLASLAAEPNQTWVRRIRTFSIFWCFYEFDRTELCFLYLNAFTWCIWFIWPFLWVHKNIEILKKFNSVRFTNRIRIIIL